MATRIVLASGSAARQSLLANAGVTFDVVPSRIDEGVAREALYSGGDAPDPSDVAEVLARAKATDVSAREAGAIVIGGDQVLSLDERVFQKPADMDEARGQLLELRGRTHALHTAVVIAEDGEVTWAHVDVANITMRSFSAAFVGQYLAMAGPDILQSVGCYHLEGLGVQLMEDVSGDFFTVLGLPMLPLLAELRARGVVGS